MTFDSNGSGSLGPLGDEAAERHELVFDPQGLGSLLWLHITNIVFMVLTLFVYRFWAITRIRRAIWPRMRLDGTPLEYTGTGLEIFLGFLKVFLLILLPYGIFSNWVQSHVIDPELGISALFTTLSLISSLGIFFLYTAAKYLAYRYRVNRTQWRGIRGSVDGAAYIYALKFIGCYALVAITLGIMKPWADVKMLQYKFDNTKFGGQPFWFSGNTTGLWVPYLIFMAIPLITLCSINLSDGRISVGLRIHFDSSALLHWHTAALSFIGIFCTTLAYLNYQIRFWRKAASNVTFGAARFRFHPTLARTAGFYIGNALIVTLSLGLLLPLVWLRKGAFLAQHLEIAGDLNLGALVQAEFDTDSRGEGLLGDFDIA